MRSKCGFCNNFRFVLKEVSPEDSRFKFYFIQCASCGVPVGVTDYSHTHTAIQETNAKIQKLENKISDTDSLLRQVLTVLSSRR